MKAEIWRLTLHKSLDDSEVTQTILIVEDDVSVFKVVQRYDLKRYRGGRKSGTPAPRATYCRGSICETREKALQEAGRLVAKYLMNQWRIAHDEPTA